MTLLSLTGLVLALAVSVYLLYVMIRPERF